MTAETSGFGPIRAPIYMICIENVPRCSFAGAIATCCAVQEKHLSQGTMVIIP